MARWTYLMTVALLCLIGQSMAEHCFDVETSKRISFDDLMDDLGRCIFNTGGINYYLTPRSVGLKVATSLARTIGKRKARASLHGFSVDGLLKLNKFGPADCATAKLQERRKTCEMFSTEQQGNEFTPSLLPTKEEYVKRNLGTYCWKIRMVIVDWCNDRRVDVIAKQMCSSDEWALDAIGFKLKESIPRMMFDFGKSKKYEYVKAYKPIHEKRKGHFAGKAEEPSESKLIEACDKLREKFGPLVEEKVYLKDWQEYWNYCRDSVKQTKES